MRFILPTLILLFYGQIQSQPQIKDYFIPEGKNKSIFYSMPNSSHGKSSDWEKYIWFIKRGESFELLESNTANGKTGYAISLFVEIRDDKVLLTKSVSTTLVETNKKKVYNPPQIYLKLPSPNKKATWRYTEPSGDKFSCTSEFSTVEIDGQVKKSIKVKKILVSGGIELVEQYVFGIGLWQEESKSGILINVLKEQILDPNVE